MNRSEAIDTIFRRARESESAMVRVLSRGEVEWLIQPLLDALDEAYPGDAESPALPPERERQSGAS